MGRRDADLASPSLQPQVRVVLGESLRSGDAVDAPKLKNSFGARERGRRVATWGAT